MPPRASPLVVIASCDWRGVAGLTVVRVDGSSVTLSTGEVLIARYEKLRALCEQLVQEGCPISIRTWMSSDGPELIEVHRGENSTDPPTANLGGSDDAAF